MIGTTRSRVSPKLKDGINEQLIEQGFSHLATIARSQYLPTMKEVPREATGRDRGFWQLEYPLQPPTAYSFRNASIGSRYAAFLAG
jgi:hypothetical protein